MTRAKLAQEALKLLSGGTGWFVGLSLLSTVPLTAVLVILGAMSFLLIPAARLCGTEVRRLSPEAQAETRRVRQDWRGEV